MCERERKDSGTSLGSGSGLDSQQGWELWVGDPHSGGWGSGREGLGNKTRKVDENVLCLPTCRLHEGSPGKAQSPYKSLFCFCSLL